MRRSSFLSGGVALVTAGVTMAAVYGLAVRRHVSAWGATPEEVDRPLPGDEIIARPRLQTNHGITIQAPAAAIWPWLVQIGCGRAGWYSYDRLDNGGVPSARQIMPEFQDLKVGDRVEMTPDGGLEIPVALMQAPEYLVLGGADARASQPGAAAGPGTFFGGTWGFYLDEVGKNATRLLVRVRLDWGGGPATLPFYALEPIGFIMDQRLLKNLKERVEGQGT